MSIQDIILIVVIALAAGFVLRKLYTIFISKELPSCGCHGCKGSCGLSSNESDNDCSDKNSKR